MSYRDAIKHGETNVSPGMVPHKAKCRCLECQNDRLRDRISALERDAENVAAFLRAFDAWAEMGELRDGILFCEMLDARAKVRAK